MILKNNTNKTFIMFRLLISGFLFILLLIVSDKAIALNDFSESKCNKKCQAVRKANKNACKLFMSINKDLIKSMKDREENKITREFHKNYVLNLSDKIRKELSADTKDDLEVYMSEYAFWLNFYARNVSPENISYKINATQELLNRYPLIGNSCKSV